MTNFSPFCFKSKWITFRNYSMMLNPDQKRLFLNFAKVLYIIWFKYCTIEFNLQVIDLLILSPTLMVKVFSPRKSINVKMTYVRQQNNQGRAFNVTCLKIERLILDWFYVELMWSNISQTKYKKKFRRKTALNFDHGLSL